MSRRFPPPWSVDEENAACFISRGKSLAYVYFEDEPGRWSAAKMMTREARRIAAKVASLPSLLPRWLDSRRTCPRMTRPSYVER
jgi:hypothetical protein